MRIHRTLAEAVIKGLDEIFNQGRYADKAIEFILKSNKKWGSRDRAFIASNTYDAVRWWRLLGYLTDTENRNDKDACWLKFGALLFKNGLEIPEWKEFRNLDLRKVDHLLTENNIPAAVKYSVPDWLYLTGKDELSDKWEDELEALNQQAALVIRVNLLKADVQSVQKILDREGIQTEMIAGIPDALRIPKRVNLFTLESFKNGLYDIQDASSQRIAPLLQIEPGMRVIDACAGAGGKSLHLAALMKNKGHLISMDVSERKLEELKRRARRAGVNNTETRVIDNNKVIKRLEASADRLLLDVPCSGLGVLRRNPDAKWKLNEEFLVRIRETQQQIISTYSSMVKPGGKMVYATCSILPSENEKQVELFLKNHTEFTLDEQHRISATEGFDGFFMALLSRAK